MVTDLARSNTAENSKRGSPFKKGDARINRHGRPRNFDALRALALAIASEEIEAEGDGGPVRMTRATAIMRRWAESDEPALQKAFIEIAYGRVPEKLDVTGDNLAPVIILKHAHELTQEERARAQAFEQAGNGHR